MRLAGKGAGCKEAVGHARGGALLATIPQLCAVVMEHGTRL
ncbi:hypothetical protein BSU04_46820 [Caballeronia sordidicola]|jgi:hypothetical protein|uniref:Uncharacterized protein n=1 Tax=Caballeronia sordidicola TaxID=196367 RepID=A0A226WK08_CABSO|nr:hypothetical protein BSU04_46820 [Caballeronia sordidicola]